MHNIDWCERGLQLSDITTKNVSDNDLTPRMKYIMVRLDNWDRKLVQEGWHNTGYSVEQEFLWIDYIELKTWLNQFEIFVS